MQKPILETLNGKAAKTPPIWLMRQAGRYLPEYRELRAKSESFMSFCFDPKCAAEATLQPIRRFGFDAAILFSDILVIPHALGQHVSFETGEGPRLPPIASTEDFNRLRKTVDMSMLSPVFEAIDRIRSMLPRETTLIGFCGAPWTVASYMIAGKGTPDQSPARLFAYREPELFQRLIDLLVDSSIDYLAEQFTAGVETVQIFDSWAGVLPANEIEQWCISPLRRIVEGLRARVGDKPIIAFPRGATSYLSKVCAIDGVSAIGLDTSVDPEWAARAFPSTTFQGNLDPLALLAGGDPLDRAIDRILDAHVGTRHIFNLGHGILPPTPIDHVQRLLERVRNSG